MPRRGRREGPSAAIARTVRPLETSRIGVRELTGTGRSGPWRYAVDPSAFSCGLLVAQLADEWITHAEVTGVRHPGKSATAIRRFGSFVDGWAREHGAVAGEVRLDGGPVNVAELVFGWEQDLQREFSPPSTVPYDQTSRLLALIAQRAARDPDVPETLRAKAAAPATMSKTTCTPLDEFSQAERLALREAARRDVRLLEERLAHGRTLLARGDDPREAGWERLENLVWAADAGILSVEALRPHLSLKVGGWPACFLELARTAGIVAPGPHVGVAELVLAVAKLLYPQEVDLQPLRVLLLLEMGDCTPEELLDLTVDGVEFTDGGVRVRQTKARAGRTRNHLHTSDDVRLERGAGQWDVPGLLRRLLAVTADARRWLGQEWLFTAVEFRGTGCRRIGPGRAAFTGDGRRLTHWIARHDEADGHPALTISRPHDARRLRKTAKTTRVVALGGSLTDLAADDHHIEVFRTHYAHGTTAHVLAGRAVNRAQTQVFRKITRPLFVPADAEQSLASEPVAAEAGMNAPMAAAMTAGELDMGLVNCRDPYASPFTAAGRACHVAPAMCMRCRNAVVFTSHLPRLVRLAEHIETMRLRMPPPHWQAVWGTQAKALAELFEQCTDQMPQARRQAAALHLDLPLGMRTEYDR